MNRDRFDLRYATRLRGSAPFPRIGPKGAVLALVFMAAAAAQPPDSNAIMGFESTAAWAANGNGSGSGAVSTSPLRTQGSFALAIADPPNHLTLTSLAVASTATALAGVGTPGAAFEVDVFLPTQQGNPHNAGSVKLSISSRSTRLNNDLIGEVSLNGLRTGLYTTLQFPIPDKVSSGLGGAAFNDLSFQFDVQSPGKTTGTYIFDNLRVHSIPPVTGVRPAGYGGSVDLVVFGGSGNPGSPVTTTFPIGPVQIPNGFHLKLGTARPGTSVELQLGLDGAPSFTCTYFPDASDATDRSYIFTSCTGGFQPGDLIGANWALLGIVNGDNTMKIRAQLAQNPMGDLLGGGLLPPMPTFWGDFDSCAPKPTPGTVVATSTSCANQTALANQIVTNYFNQVQNANPVGNWVVTPAPLYAQRLGDPTPVNTLSGPPPPPHDPPFDYSWHLNAGGSWDAYAEISGSSDQVAVAGSDLSYTSFDARVGTHAVVWGYDVDVLDLEAAATASTPESYPIPTGAVSKGTITSYMFGVQFPTDCCTFNVSGTNPVHLTYPLPPGIGDGFEYDFDLPPIEIWIFEITAGIPLKFTPTLDAMILPASLDAKLTLDSSLGLHIQGGVDAVVASGDVDASIQLVDLTPVLETNLNWNFDYDPGVCQATTGGAFTGNLTLSSGGGEVDLEAKIGPCPFCYHPSYTLIKWGPLASHTFNLWSSSLIDQYPFPQAACTKPLSVTMYAPPATGATFPAGLPVTLNGNATLPNANPIVYPTTVPCSDLTWTFTPAVAGQTMAPVTGCTPTVKFPAPAGSSAVWTVNLSASESFNNSQGTITDTGSAAPAQVTVTNLSNGVYITQLTDSAGQPYSLCSPTCSNTVTIFPSFNDILSYTIQGLVNGATGALSTTFTVRDYMGNPLTVTTNNPTTATPSATWTPPYITTGSPPVNVQLGTFTITMTTTAGGSPFGTTTATAQFTIIE